MDFINEHWTEIAGVVALVILLAERIALLTPTETDNRVVAWLYKAASIIGLKVEDNKGKIE